MSSVPGLATQPRTNPAIPDTIYVREVSEESGKQGVSEDNAETESLLSADAKEDGTIRRDLLTVRNKEEEHQLMLRALQKRFVCPIYAARPAPPSTPKTSFSNIRTPKINKPNYTTGHMRLIPAEKSKDSDQQMLRLEDALRSGKPPFDAWENLLDKLSGVQQKQLTLNYANLEMAWSKSMGDYDNGAVFREHLATFQDMMDDLSKDILLMQGIDPRDSSDTLPRRRSSDQPDLPTLHARLFRSQSSFDPIASASVPSFLQSDLSSPSATVSGLRAASTSFIPADAAATRPVRPASKTPLSEPPKYPPPVPPAE